MIEHEILASAFEATPVPVFVVDAELRIVFVNRAARDASTGAGIDSQQLVGNCLLDILTFLPSNIRETYELVLRTGEAIAGETSYEVAGETMRVEVIRYPILGKNQITHVGVCFKDITELRRTQEALRISEETAWAIMNASTESMTLSDGHGTLLALNAVAAKRLGKSAGDLIGRTGDMVYSPEAWEDRKRRFAEVIHSGQPMQYQERRDGRVHDITINPVKNPGGHTYRIAIFAHDITDYEKMLHALEESENRFRDLFQRTPVPSFVFQGNGTDFVLKKANAAADQLTGNRIGPLLGRTAANLYSESSPWIIDDLKECYSTKSYLVREVQHVLQTTGETKYFQAHYVYVPPDTVLVHAVDLTDRRAMELAKQDFYAELEQRVVERTRELASVNDQLRVERESLNQKNAALRELITQLNDSKKTLAGIIRTNLERVTLPILERVESRLDETGRSYLKMFRESLDEILSPHMAELQKHHPYLTAHEIDLCNLIRGGLTSKEIAAMRGRSEQTILKQRTLIRRKLGLTDEKINLRNYLLAVGLEDSVK